MTKPDLSLALTLPTKAGDKKWWGGVSGSAKGMSISEAATQHKGITLVIASDNTEAELLSQQLPFFTQHNNIPFLHLPDWETLPYDTFSPHQDIISERLETLSTLPRTEKGILVVAVSTLMQRLAPQDYLLQNSVVFSVNQTLNPVEFLSQLEKSGYNRVESVYEHGDFTVRGSIIDLFPMGSSKPYRIELLDDDIDSIRTFDPETQRTIEKVNEIKLLPAKEFPLDKASISLFKDRWCEAFDVEHRQCAIYNAVSDGLPSPGMEYYLDLFFEQTATLFDYLPEDTLVILPNEIETSAQRFWHDVNTRYDQYNVDPHRPLLKPSRVFTPVDELFSQLKSKKQIILKEDNLAELDKAGRLDLPFSPPEVLTVDSRSDTPLLLLQKFVQSFNGRILFCAESAGRREALIELLSKIKLKPKDIENWADFISSNEPLGITVAPLDSGLIYQPNDNGSDALALIAESQLFGERIQQRRRRKKASESLDNVIKDLTELQIGAPVVHIDHGIGRYQGLESIEIDGQSSEFLTLIYADDAKLYVPVSSLHLIGRYSGADADHAPLNKLGSEQWQKAKKKAAEKIRDVAAELLEIYASRAAKKGYKHNIDMKAYNAFSASFPFEETPDQEVAIQNVLNDMQASTPMDRLVCGDVGFGKTEVAMRAAFIAVNSGKQVAVLVPTTLLAQQHYENFRDRFADHAVKVEVLSRFKSDKEQKQALEQLEAGKVDIVIGTHKLIQPDIKYKDLGLVIIDEEHRFGVRQKEALKQMRTETDIVTLTATPIPRTLNMSMSGMRDLSIIATPPAKRLSVKTFVRQQDDIMLKEAILRELLRGGQVYYLHNEVKNIEKRARDLEELIPEAKVAIAHGQMRERELEQIMSDFYHKRFNILLCTTIIETGIDVPSANTIIIERADRFGLAQLHQLRGRVGRSHHQAYAYLMTPPEKTLTKDAVKRLEAIEASSHLGAGFMLATHDLEIRGAGELLGDDQSGQIQTIGFSLYMEMLERTVKAIQKGETIQPEESMPTGAEVNLRLPALLPDDYLPDVHTRLTLYKRLATTQTKDELKELQVEMIDRFGLLPEPAKNLIQVTRIKQKAEQAGIRKIELGPNGGKVEFDSNTPVDPMKIVTLVQKDPMQYRMDGATGLKITHDLTDRKERLVYINTLIDTLVA